MCNYEIHRGDVYFVGHKKVSENPLKLGYPAIVVSDDVVNKYSPAVKVVFLRMTEEENLPTRCAIRSKGWFAVALCEDIETVSKDYLFDYKGVITKEEMEAVNICLANSIGIFKDYSALRVENKVLKKQNDKLLECLSKMTQ